MIKNNVINVAIESTTRELYSSFADKVKDVVIMAEEEQLFLLQMILDKNPKKILEMGVARGGSTAIILNGIKHNPEAKLYSLDIRETMWDDDSKPIGFIIKEKFPELLKQWSLFVGKKNMNSTYEKNTIDMIQPNDITNRHYSPMLEEIGRDIDFCLLDTAHINPGEFLDFLMIFPYLKDDCMVVIHDTQLHMYTTEFHIIRYTTGVLTSSLKGDKYSPAKINNSYQHVSGLPLPNISAVKINKKDNESNIYDLFNLLSLPWNYNIDDREMELLVNHFRKFYDEDLVSMLIDTRKYYLDNKDHNYGSYLNKKNEKDIIPTVQERQEQEELDQKGIKQNIKNKFIEKDLIGEWDFMRTNCLVRFIYQTIKLPYVILKIIIKLIK